LNQININLIALFLLFGILLFHQIGVKVGLYRKRLSPDSKSEGIGPLESALFGLLALLLSFTFNISNSKYEARKALIITESNNIFSTIQRLDLYPDSIRTELRNDLRQYLDLRILYYNAGEDYGKVNQDHIAAQQMLNKIWGRVAQISKQSLLSRETSRDGLMAAAISAMRNSMSDRDVARANVPMPIILLLFGLCLLDSFIIGYSKKEKRSDWVILTFFTLMMVVSIYTIMDLDRPISGIITTDHSNEKMIELKDMLKD